MLKRLVALGREPGFFDINVTRHDVFSSFREPIAFAAKRFGGAAEVARHERVAVRRLEDVLDELCGSARHRAVSEDGHLRDEPTGRVIEFDCVMVRPAALPPPST
jgi:hypothetical protein